MVDTENMKVNFVYNAMPCARLIVIALTALLF